MIKEVDSIIVTKNLELNGNNVVHTYAIEECAELQKELTKDLRNKGDRKHIIEEVSHVYYVCSMLRQSLDITDAEINEEIIKAELKAMKDLNIT